MGTVFDALLGKQGLNTLIGGTPEEELAEGFARTRDMRPGSASTLGKAERTRAIAMGLRGLPRRKRAATVAEAVLHRVLTDPGKVPFVPKRPSIVRVLGKATFRNAAGETKDLPYLHTVDRSRYTSEKLRELRRTRR